MTKSDKTSSKKRRAQTEMEYISLLYVMKLQHQDELPIAKKMKASHE